MTFRDKVTKLTAENAWLRKVKKPALSSSYFSKLRALIQKVYLFMLIVCYSQFTLDERLSRKCTTRVLMRVATRNEERQSTDFSHLFNMPDFLWRGRKGFSSQFFSPYVFAALLFFFISFSAWLRGFEEENARIVLLLSLILQKISCSKGAS